VLESVGLFFDALGPTIWSILDQIGVYVILALGLNLINGMAGLFSIGHAGFWAIGAYATAAMVVHNPLGLPIWLAFLVGVVLAIALAAVAGFILAVSCLRLAGDYLAIATLGFSIIVVNLLYNFDYVGAATGISVPTVINKAVIWVGVALVLVFYYRLQFSNLGRLIQSIREDEIAAQSIGINRVRIKTLAVVLGSAVAGFAGALFAGSANYLNPSGFEFDQSIKILTMVVLGGLGSITGVFVAAVLLTLMPELLRLLSLEDYQMLVFAGVLLLMVLLRPQGLLGGRELWDMGALRSIWHPDGVKPVDANAANPGASA
jgi:branched-chain amino acid transport system permease protein